MAAAAKPAEEFNVDELAEYEEPEHGGEAPAAADKAGEAKKCVLAIS